jgi:hypothetical protein
MLLITIQLGSALRQHSSVARHESFAREMRMGTETVQTQHAVEIFGLLMDKAKSVLLHPAQCYP